MNAKKLFMLATMFLVFSTPVFAEDVNLGLIHQLAKLKYGAESHLNAVMSHENVTKGSKAKVSKAYNEIRSDLNSILYQLSADMRLSNCTKKYKILNEFYQSNTLDSDATGDLKDYKTALKLVKGKYDAFLHINIDFKSGKEKSFTLADFGLVEAATLVWTVAKESSELREKKVTNIISIVEAMMIDPIEAKEDKDAKPSIVAEDVK